MKRTGKVRVPLLAAVRGAVRGVLARSEAFASLPATTRRSITADTTAVAAVLVGGAPAAVDLPGFVAGLVQGVFQAVVDASVQQMQAYGALVGAVAATLPAADPSESERRRLARRVSMGVNRLVVTSGASPVRPSKGRASQRSR